MDSIGSMDSSSSSRSSVVPVDDVNKMLIQVIPSSNQEWHRYVSKETRLNHLEKLVRAMLPKHCLTEGVVEEKTLEPLCYNAGIMESRAMDLAQSVEEYRNDIAKHIIDIGNAAEKIWAQGQLNSDERISGAENDLQVPGCSGEDPKASGSSKEDPKASVSPGEDSKLSSEDESNVSGSSGDHKVSGSPGDNIQVSGSSREDSLVSGSSREDSMVSGSSREDS